MLISILKNNDIVAARTRKHITQRFSILKQLMHFGVYILS